MLVLMGHDIDMAQRQALWEMVAGESASMLDIRNAAGRFGVALVGVKAEYAELAGIVGPVLVHLSNPGHFVVVLRQSRDWMQVIDEDRVCVLPRGELEKRYSGHAMVVRREYVGPRAQFEVDDFQHDFGAVVAGTEVRHVFQVTNTGQADLSLGFLRKACCGAPDVEIEKGELAPGDSTDVSVSFVATPGRDSTSVRLLTTDPADPVVFLTIRCSVAPGVYVTPAALYIPVRKGGEAERTIVIAGPSQVSLIEATSESDFVQTTVDEPTEGDGFKQWVVRVKVSAGTKVGEIRDLVTVRTTDVEHALIEIPVIMHVSGDLVASRKALFFGFGRFGASAAPQTVRIHSLDGSRFAVTGIATSSPEIIATGMTSLN
ncbi:MAG: DUF1573 domain-containing protein, partial [candidate division WS1 bacterium]|nr:DUF1573 domain-containing protein [candidate division WS1 bacterium]